MDQIIMIDADGNILEPAATIYSGEGYGRGVSQDFALVFTARKLKNAG